MAGRPPGLVVAVVSGTEPPVLLVVGSGGVVSAKSDVGAPPARLEVLPDVALSEEPNGLWFSFVFFSGLLGFLVPVPGVGKPN